MIANIALNAMSGITLNAMTHLAGIAKEGLKGR